MKLFITGLALALAVRLPVQEKVTLGWNPPAQRVILVKASIKWRGPDFTFKDGDAYGEAELHPTDEKNDAGRIFILKGNSYVATKRDGDKRGDFRYERGKPPVQQGETVVDSTSILHMEDDHKVTIGSNGLRRQGGLDHPLVNLSTGYVQIQLPPTPVRAGSNWVSEADFWSTTLYDFKGKFKCTVKNIEKGKTATVALLAVPDLIEDGTRWAGSGTLVYSFAEGLVSEVKLKLVKTDKEGKVQQTLEHSLAQSLKP